MMRVLLVPWARVGQRYGLLSADRPSSAASRSTCLETTLYARRRPPVEIVVADLAREEYLIEGRLNSGRVDAKGRCHASSNTRPDRPFTNRSTIRTGTPRE